MIKLKLLLIIVTFSLLQSCKSADDYLNEAQRHEDKEEFKEAILLLNMAVKKRPDFIDAYLSRAADEAAISNCKAAIQDYTHVLEISPKNTLALFNRGNNRSRLGDYKGAVSDYKKAIDSKGGEVFWVDYTPNQFEDLSKYDCKMEIIRLQRAFAYYNLDSLNRSYSDIQFCISKGYCWGDDYKLEGLIYIAAHKKDSGCMFLERAKYFGDTQSVSYLKQYCR